MQMRLALGPVGTLHCRKTLEAGFGFCSTSDLTIGFLYITAQFRGGLLKFGDKVGLDVRRGESSTLYFICISSL